MRNRTKTFLAAVFIAIAAAVALPRSTSAAQAGRSPVKVFILAGQSNMEGAGAIRGNPANGGKGSLEYLVKDPRTAGQFAHVIDKNGRWVVRDDVWIWYFDRRGGLTAGYGARKDRIGPEFQFGHRIGDYFDNQVLLIKTAWGGKSLAKDFRPPSSGGQVGPFYTAMIRHVREVVGNLKTLFPDYDGRGYEITGFGWHQGWNDGCSAAMVAEYEKNLANLIRDVRKDLGVKDLPFVIADSGFGGRNQKVARRLGIRKAQAVVATYPEFRGNVFCVQTQDFFRPPEQSPSRHGYHWNCNAETYFLIGDAMARAMIDLIEARGRRAGEHRAAQGAGRDRPGRAHPDTSDWPELFKPDLSNAICPKGVWSCENGILTATKDICIWTAKQYDNFVLDLEFKTAPGTNSGVIVYCTDTKQWIPNSVEIQIADDYAAKWAKAPRTWQCGAIFGHLAPRKRTVKKPGEWNRFTITCRGKIIEVMLNGEVITVMDMSRWTSAKKNPDGSSIPPWLSKPKATLPTRGHIGFQGKHAGAPIWFRNIRIKELPAG